MSEVLIHVVLQRAIGASRTERRRVYENIVSVARLRDVNDKRFERYGILTAWVDAKDLDRIRKIPGVESVDADRDRVALA
jgi:hypothetical protein